MPKYLWHATYTTEGARGLLKDGATSRRQAVERLAESAGGKLEGFYYAFGETDAFVIADLPDNSAATAIALTINSSGAAVVKTTVLMTPEEVDQALKKKVDYRPPGQ